MRAAEIIKALRDPSPAANVDKLIDDDVSPLVERLVTAGRNIRLIRSYCVDYVHALYVLAARQVSDAKRIEQIAKLDAAHHRAEATELYRALRAAYGELDKIRFGRRTDSTIIAAIGDELAKFDRLERYGSDDDN